MLAPTILMTGFGPFEGCPVNPGIEALSLAQSSGAFDDVDADIIVEEVPTEWIGTEEAFCRAVNTHRPHAILSFGTSPYVLPHFVFEKIGRNVRSLVIPDAVGKTAPSARILNGGPKSVETTMPFESLRHYLRLHGSGLIFSDNAGDFLCNFLIYSGARSAREMKIPFGFFHLPLLKEEGNAELKSRVMDICSNDIGRELSWEDVVREYRLSTIQDAATTMGHIAAFTALHLKQNRG